MSKRHGTLLSHGAQDFSRREVVLLDGITDSNGLHGLSSGPGERFDLKAVQSRTQLYN
jgi:hypothetical protein